MFLKVKDINETLQEIKDLVEHKDEVIENLRKENERLRSETYKDSELKRLKEKLEEARFSSERGFCISEKEGEKISNWIQKHEYSCRRKHGLASSKYSYKFTPTTVGVVGVVECDCGETFVFSDL